MKRVDRNATRVVSRGSGEDFGLTSGLYHKLHGVPRPVAMKKTVIKRRKRVPAVGAQQSNATNTSTPRAGSTNPNTAENSPANPPASIPHAPSSLGAGPPSHTQPYDRPPFAMHGARPLPGHSAPNPDPLGLRRGPSSSAGKSVPLLLSNPVTGERKKPWWIDDRHETPSKTRDELEREARERDQQRGGEHVSRDREGVSPTFLIPQSPLSPDYFSFPAICSISLLSFPAGRSWIEAV